MDKILLAGFALLAIVLLAAAEGFALENSTIVCIDNDTLQENVTIYKDGNSSTLSLATHCNYGCDNATIMCSPPTYQQSLFNIAILAFVIIVSALIYRWKR